MIETMETSVGQDLVGAIQDKSIEKARKALFDTSSAFDSYWKNPDRENVSCAAQVRLRVV